MKSDETGMKHFAAKIIALSLIVSPSLALAQSSTR
jgi:hypothetical protein